MIDIAKQSFCSDVFNGRLFPFEMLCANNERYNKARNKYKEKETLLLNMLNDEQTMLYEKAQDCSTECQIAQTEQAFKMGLKYAFEMLKDLKDIEFIKEIE